MRARDRSSRRIVAEPVWLIAPAWVYDLVLLAAPLVIVVAYAFADREGFFTITFGLYGDNLRRLWDPVYLRIYRDTFLSAGAATAGCLAVGLPLAYWLATRVKRHRTLLLLLVIVPFWTSILIRTYAWALLFRPRGPLYQVTHALGIVDQPLNLLGTWRAVFVGLVYDYLPLMVFPLYVALERLDRSLVEAAKDLGANRWRAFVRATLPVAMPGVVTGCLLVFIPMTGEYVVPTFLGGGKGRWFGPIVADQFLEALNYPFGAAMSLVLVVALLLLIAVYLRALRGRPGGLEAAL